MTAKSASKRAVAKRAPRKRRAWRRDDEAQTANEKLGQRIRSLREQRKISLNAASDLTGIPAATLSRIETNKMAPTFPVLLKLMIGLRIPWGSLIGIEPTSAQEGIVSISEPGDATATTLPGYAYLTPHADSALIRHVQPLILDVLARTVEEAGGLRGHSGVEFCYVLQGELALHFANESPRRLSQGGSALFMGELPHAYVAQGRGKTKVLVVVQVDPLMVEDRRADLYTVRVLRNRTTDRR